VALVALSAFAACRQDMHDQLKLEPLEQSSFFADGRGSRDPVEGTVARGHLRADRHLYEGKRVPTERDLKQLELTPENAPEFVFVETFPENVDEHVLARGRERYDVFCSPCHAKTGRGDGMVVRRGFRRPPPLWNDQLRRRRVGELFDNITNGVRSMPAYKRQIPVRDRWAIVAYVRALQLSQHAEIDRLPPDVRRRAQEALIDVPSNDSAVPATPPAQNKPPAPQGETG